jgi:hypothetical protein
MTRVRASSLHLGVSSLVAVVLFAAFWWIWYRAPLFEAVGGLQIFLMLLAIDVILGPLLTLIVYKEGKKTLKFDLAVICLVQFAALCYGVYTLLVARPVYIAGLGHRFDVVHANEIDSANLGLANKTLPIWGVEWVGTKRPDDKKERERVLFSGVDYGHFPQHHQPLENMRDELLARARPISELKRLNPEDHVAIDRWIEGQGMKPEQLVFQGLKAPTKDMAVILDAKTAKVVGIAPFKPWE